MGEIMPIISVVLLLLMLFFALGKTADLIVFHLRRVGEDLGLNLYFLGFVLGAFTSLPELTVGINAVLNDVAVVALGNLMGGIMVVFGLIFGASIVVNRKIETNPKDWLLPVILVYLMLPIVLGANGVIGKGEGALMIGLYLLLLALLLFKNQQKAGRRWRAISKRDLSISTFWVGVGLVLVVVLANVIIDSTVLLLKDFGISFFIIGLIIYGIGTNLPEIIITIRSWVRQVRELSESNLIGSAMANVLITGILSFMRPITLQLGWPHLVTAVAMAVLLTMLYFFWRSQARFVRREGWMLLSVYLVFVGLQIFIASQAK